MKISQNYWILFVFLAFASVLLLWSCYPDSGLTEAGDFDLIITQYDPEQDFSQFETYIMPDSVVHIVEEGKEDEITHKYDEKILANVSRNMQNLNYVLADTGNGQSADIILVVFAASTKWEGYTWAPGWGGWYGWWGYPGYPWYPYYPGYAVPYSFETGTVLIELYDADDYNPADDTIPVRWTAAINGLLEDSKSNIEYRLNRDIDQCFKQSPYLGR